MAKRRHAEELEIPFVALMDTMTNVVGVLIIVLVLVGIAVASAVKKILSDLPPVTKEQLEELQKIMVEKKEIPDPKELLQKIAALEENIRKGTEDLATLDKSAVGMNLADIPDLEKQLADKKAERDKKRAETEAMLAELDKLKATLDQTPVVAAAPGTVVRLPNPKPYPETPNETKIIVAKEGVLFLNDRDFLGPVADKLEQRRSQLLYKDPDPTPFVPLMEKLLGSKAAAQAAWPALSGLVGTYQMDSLAGAWKVLNEAQLQPSAGMLETLGSISLVVRKPMPDVAAAVVAATKGDYAPWTALDPSTDPLKPTIKVVPDGRQVNFSWGSATEKVDPDQRGVLKYFATLGDTDQFKKAADSRVVYDAYKMVEFLKSSAVTGSLPSTFGVEPKIRPGSTQIQLALTPRSGETIEKMKQPGSVYVRVLRAIKDDPGGVALFQVVPDAIPTYLQAREMADQVGVAATWDFRADLNIVMNIPGFEVQRFAEPPKGRPASTTTIAPPKRTLD